MATLSKSQLSEIFERYQQISPDLSHGPQQLSRTRIAVMVANTVDKPQEGLEKIRGTNNLTSVAALLRAFEVSVSVGLVYNSRRNDVDSAAVGTGFLIAPHLMLTNHHVIQNKEQAADFGLMMNYQRDLEGRVASSFRYRLDTRLFYTSEKLDFTIVGVEPYDRDDQHRPLTSFGYLKLIEESGKISTGEFTSLTGHPNGRPKQIVLFENSVLYDKNDRFILYSADTEEGSSGSPLFNYEWVVVALHHAGVPQSMAGIDTFPSDQVGENDFPRAANEGIRISAIMAELKKEDTALYTLIKQAEKAPLKDSLPVDAFKDARQLHPAVPSGQASGGSEVNNKSNPVPVKTSGHVSKQNDIAVMSDQNIIRLNIPLEIHLGAIRTTGELNANEGSGSGAVPAGTADKINTNLDGREGYRSDFLSLDIALDKLYDPFLKKGALAPTLENGVELAYTHFSMVMHKIRKMCVITAVNIDGSKAVSVPRNDDWQLDGRMDARYQLGNAVYTNNDLDRGHMVRREDPNWGADAAAANADTFHYTNACPQHKDLNQKTWLSLEDYLLGNAKLRDLKISVFTGPVLDENYVHYREALVPVQFYKIAAMIKQDGNPSVTGYLLTQKDLVSGLEAMKTDFVFGEFKTYQVALEKIEAITGLDLTLLKPYDPLQGAFERVPREILGAEDILI